MANFWQVKYISRSLLPSILTVLVSTLTLMPKQVKALEGGVSLVSFIASPSSNNRFFKSWKAKLALSLVVTMM